MAARAEVAAATRERYAASGRAAKGAILDEFVALTGLHRKHAIRLLGAGPAQKRRRGRPRTRCGAAARDALVVLWEASDRVCSKRLAPMIPVLLPALERHGQLALDAELRAKLLAVSPATIDRLLSETRIAAAQGRRRRAGFSAAARRSVPVRTPDRVGGRLFGDWATRRRGSWRSTSWRARASAPRAPLCESLVLTDIATGWTECVPVLMRAGALALEALQAAQGLFPLPASGRRPRQRRRVHERARGRVVPSSGARGHALAGLTRKNDQAWVERKNGAIVRRLVGHGRLEGRASAAALARPYAAARLHAGLFQPSFELREKTQGTAPG